MKPDISKHQKAAPAEATRALPQYTGSAMADKREEDPLAATAAAPLSAPRGQDAVRRFHAGAVIAERYRLIDLVGTGGMGEVYAAEDLLLKERVALKTVRGDVAKDETAAARFKREIQLARRVTHANVCRIFDVGMAGDVPFVTMELLSGETLAARLKRGRMAAAEALAVAQQLVAALSAAHEVEVVHRDFKSANIMLVDRGGSRGVRAVVTDFGLARALQSGAEDQSLTRDGGIMGSPAYMAPEQVEGKRNVGAAADIYSLGVVLYEMVTGELPFVGVTPLETMTMRLRTPPRPPRSLVPDLPARWQDTILRCLALEPTQRFARVADVADALAVGPSRRKNRRVLAGVAAAALLVAGGAGWLMVRDRAGMDRVVPARDGRPSVAIVGFRNLGARADGEYLGPLLGEFLATDLSAGDTLLTIDAESVARARRELSLPDAESFARDTLKKIHGLLGTDFVVVGSYLVEGDTVNVDLKLQDTRSGATVAGVTEKGGKGEMVALVARVGGRIRARLGAGELSAAQREGVRASLPRGTEAQKRYAEGVAHLRLQACGPAVAPLEQAVAAEPSFPLAHVALSEALWCIGFESRAEEEARKGVELSAGLPDEVRLAAEARLQFTENDVDRYLATMKTLAARRPDDLRVGVELVGILTASGDIVGARATLARLRGLPGGDSAVLDLRRAIVESTRGQVGEPVPSVAERIAMFDAVRKKAETQGARLVAAEALFHLNALYTEADDPEKALAAALAAKEILRSSGDRDGVVQALAMEVKVYQGRGDLEAVRRARAEAQATAGEIDSTRSLASFERAVGRAFAAAGDFAAARAVQEELRAWCHGRGKQRDEGAAYLEIARLQIQGGDPEGAERSIAAARVLKRWLGALEFIEGGLGFMEGGLATYRGNLAAARAAFDREIGGIPKFIPQTTRDYVQAQLDREMALAENRWPDLERLSRRLLDEAPRQRPEQPKPAAEDIRDLIVALVEQGKLADAKAERERQAGRVAELARDDFATRERFELLDAALQASSEKPADVAGAERRVERTIDRAAKAGAVVLSLEASLVLGRIQLRAHEAAGRVTLQALAKQAHARGAELLARNAEQALARGGAL